MNVLGLNFTYAIAKCLKCRNKGEDHNIQTKLYYIKFLKYVSNNMGLHVSTRIESPSGPQGVDPNVQTFAALWDPNAYRN